MGRLTLPQLRRLINDYSDTPRVIPPGRSRGALLVWRRCPEQGIQRGTLNVTSRGKLTGNGDIKVAAATATVTGANSTWTGDITLNRGTINISNGGLVSAGGFSVGEIGGGSINVTSGGRLTTGTGPAAPPLQLHFGGAVSVSDAGSTWSVFTPLIVGTGAHVSVSGGGTFDSSVSVNINNGSVSVHEAGSTWSASTLTSINSGGTLTVSSGGAILTFLNTSGNGTLKGNGRAASVLNDGIVAPGNSLGALHIDSGYTQHAIGTLQIELGGTTPDSEYDQLLVVGNVALDGTLQVSLVSPFSPAFGDAFNILDWTASLTGHFANLVLPTLGGSLGWDASQLNTTGVLSVVLAGDYNHNGTVDAADYVVWRKTLGQTIAAYTGTDANGNGLVDQGDYDVWRSHFGQSAGSGSGSGTNTAIPEPATWAPVMFAAMGVCARPRRAA